MNALRRWLPVWLPALLLMLGGSVGVVTGAVMGFNHTLEAMVPKGTAAHEISFVGLFLLPWCLLGAVIGAVQGGVLGAFGGWLVGWLGARRFAARSTK